MRAKPPCFSCPNRHEACHASCEAYTEWSNRRRAQRQEAWEKRTGDRLADNRTIDSMIRIRKRKER
jgi:hypothetical protein